MLNQEDFSYVVRVTPLVSIDLIIRDPDKRVLLGLRTNEPAKGTYFVPGGVIRKGEHLKQALARILKAETGLTSETARFLGPYEHFYETNTFKEPGYGTHYVVLAYELMLDQHLDVEVDSQHSAIRWMSETEILSAPDVHENTKAYFRAA